MSICILGDDRDGTNSSISSKTTKRLASNVTSMVDLRYYTLRTSDPYHLH